MNRAEEHRRLPIHYNLFFLVDKGSFGLPPQSCRKGLCLSKLMTFTPHLPSGVQPAQLDVWVWSRKLRSHWTLGMEALNIRNKAELGP